MARHVSIICGPIEIEGHAFCLGFNSLNLSFKNSSGLGAFIRSVIYVISGATLRPKDASDLSSNSTLSELLDMCHTREATIRHDKVYSLIGISSDDPIAAGFAPNYKLPWKTLFRQLVEFLLCKQVSVETWDESETAVVKSKGYFVSRVYMVKSDSSRYDRQQVEIRTYDTPVALEFRTRWGSEWTLKASAKAIQQDDIVCLLQGASKPSIIRMCGDHFRIIVAGVTPLQGSTMENELIVRQAPLGLSDGLLRDFLLVWNWEDLANSSQDQVLFNPVELNTKVLGLSTHFLQKAANLHNVALILGDAENYYEAVRRCEEATAHCEEATMQEQRYKLATIGFRALMHMKLGEWEKGDRQLLQYIDTQRLLNGRSHPDMLNSMTDLASKYINISSTQRGWADVPMAAAAAKDLVHRLKQDISITEQEIAKVLSTCSGNLLSLILEIGGDKITITESVVLTAARRRGSEVMAVLLDQHRDQIEITEEVLKAVARNSGGLGIMTQLLGQAGYEFQITQDVLQAAAENGFHSGEMMAIFLGMPRNELRITEEVVKAVASCDDAVNGMETLIKYRRNEVKITEDVLKSAFRNGPGGTALILFLRDQRSLEFTITEEIIKEVALETDLRPKGRLALILSFASDKIKITEDIVKVVVGGGGKDYNCIAIKQLLQQRKHKFSITEGILIEAAKNTSNGHDVMGLLFSWRESEVIITEEVVKAAAGNTRYGLELMAMLLKQRSDQVKITEDVLKAALSNESISKDMMILLHKSTNINVTIGLIEAAATSGQEKVLELFDQWGGIKDGKEKWFGISRLYNAARTGNTTAASLLIDAGVPPDKKDYHGTTPLWLAARYGHEGVVRTLLATNAVDVNVRSASGRTPIFWAAAKGYLEVVKLLLEHGAEYDYVDKDGQSPLSAAQDRGSDKVVEILVKCTGGG